MAVNLTKPAATEVKRLLAELKVSEEGLKDKTVVLRMGVRGGGCSGLSYSLEFDTEVGPHDKTFEIDGITVVVDRKSYLYLNGTTLDYVSQGLAGGFVFQNPKAKSTCGCHQSFSPDEAAGNPSSDS